MDGMAGALPRSRLLVEGPSRRHPHVRLHVRQPAHLLDGILVVFASMYLFDKKFWMTAVEGHPQRSVARAKLGSVGLCLFGWLANYLPYPLFIARTCFAYHYHPSLYFGIILCGTFLDYVTESISDPRKRTRVRVLVTAAVLLSMLVTYVYYLPFSYAIPITQDEHEERRKMYFFPIFREIFPIW